MSDNPTPESARLAAELDAAAQAEARRFGAPLHKCPGCGEVKFVGHGPLCFTCYDARVTPPGQQGTP